MKIRSFYILTLILTSISLFSLDTKARSKKTIKPQNFQGAIKSCHDGDTCRVLIDKKEIKIRFSGIDTPEINQPEGPLARDFTISQILNKIVNLECEGTSFDRTTCTVFLNEKNINEEIVRNGFAWDSPKYSKGKYQKMMVEAQNKKLGIWKTINTSPYCFRHKTSKKCSISKLYME